MEKSLNISKYRNEMMGLAMIAVVLYHSGVKMPIEALALLKSIGFAGVDVFLFLSGFGVYYSLNKNDDIVAFVKKRIVRILPYYLTVVAPLVALKWIIGQTSLSQGLGTLFVFGWLRQTPNGFNWYIPMLFILYLLSPYFFKIIKKGSKRDTILLLVVQLLVSFSFFELELLMGFSRMMVFSVGMMTAKLESENICVSVPKTVIVFFVSFVVYCIMASKASYKVLFDWGMYWYPLAIVIPAMCICLGWIFKRGGVLLPILSLIGKYSLSMYLIHCVLFGYVSQYIPMNNIRWLLLTIVCFVCAIVHQEFIGTIMRRIKG